MNTLTVAALGQVVELVKDAVIVLTAIAVVVVIVYAAGRTLLGE